jgi:Flp pilus assembly protein TadD
MIPTRPGLDTGSLQRRFAPLDAARAKALRRLDDLTDSGGAAVLWYRGRRGIDSAKLAIQPGVADDLPSLLSALAGEIGWPGAPAPLGTHPAEAVLAAWARVWQVCEDADLRLALWWDDAGVFHGEATLLPRDGAPRPLADTATLAAQLDTVARHPAMSQSPHARLLAGNAAMHDEDFPRARDLYAGAARDLPRHVEAHRNLALALARLGDWPAAAAAIRAARALAPGDPMLAQEYLALESDAGVAAVQSGDLERAAGHFLQILALWPEEPTALANLGNLRLREGRQSEARAIFHRLLKHHPTHPAAEKIRLALREMGEE